MAPAQIIWVGRAPPFSLVRPPYIPLPPSPHGSDHGSHVGVVGQWKVRESYIHLFFAAAGSTQDLFEADSARSLESRRGREGREREGEILSERHSFGMSQYMSRYISISSARAFSKSSSSPFAKQASPGSDGESVTSTSLSLEPLCASRR